MPGNSKNKKGIRWFQNEGRLKERIKRLFILIVLLNITYIFSNNDIIIIPLKSINIPDNNVNYIEALLQNQLYAEIKLGTPGQNIYLSISTETSSFSIESYLINDKFYSYNKSSTYINTDKKLSFYHEKYKSGYIFKEKFYFLNNYNINNQLLPFYNISFDCIFEISEEYNKEKYFIDSKNNLISGKIGLQIPKSYDTSSYILNSLKQNGIVNKNIWSLLYSDPLKEDKALLIIGEDPFIIGNNNYKEPKRVNPFISGIDSYWYFIFSDIKTGTIKLNKERVAEYAPQMGLIVGSAEYKNYINSTFFANLTMDNKCSEKKINSNGNNYIYYECEKNIDINNFEPIVFNHQEFSYEFTLDKNDLFIDVNNKKYFLCIFLDKNTEDVYYSNKHWILGTPYTKKYNFVFDHDSMKILFYEKKDSEKQISEGSTSTSLVWIFIIILLLVIVLVGIFFILKFLFKPKRIQANELEDTFNYNKQKNSNKETDLSVFYNSKYSQLGV